MIFRSSHFVASAVGITAIAIVPATHSAHHRTANQVYQSFCSACHDTGWNGAPLSGIRDDWTLRLGNGIEAMLKNVKQGIGTMPPMGTCTDCSDAELQATIEFMLQF